MKDVTVRDSDRDANTIELMWVSTRRSLRLSTKPNCFAHGAFVEGALLEVEMRPQALAAWCATFLAEYHGRT